MIQVDIEWPDNLSVLKIREYILSRLNQKGEPLRWAITAVNTSGSKNCSRILSVEAVVICSQE